MLRTSGPTPRRRHRSRQPTTSGGRILSRRGKTLRLLVVPAAGLGSRLGTTTPKLLTPVNGRPMIDWLIDLYRAWVDQFIVIVHPSFAASASCHVQTLSEDVHFEIQQTPTGMLDAVLLAGDRVRRSDAARVWITWCDQVAIHPKTIARLAERSDLRSPASLILPVAHRRDPYVHLERDAAGRIVRILHEREGDAMPDTGESDVGLFSLSRDAFLNDLASFAALAATGGTTGERNFLPFIPWIAAREEVVTFPCTDAIEAVGVNTPEDLQRVEGYLLARRAKDLMDQG